MEQIQVADVSGFFIGLNMVLKNDGFFRHGKLQHGMNQEQVSLWVDVDEQ